METALEYLGRTHQELKQHYDVSPVGFCQYYAGGLATRLLNEGREPFIMIIQEMIRLGEFTKETKHLFPRLYGGKVIFGGHLVCCDGKEALDPLVGKPVNLDDYTNITFIEKVPMKIHTPTEQISDFIKYNYPAPNWVSKTGLHP